MSDVNKAIIVQTSAKIASELVASAKHECLEDKLKDWQEAFDKVNDSIFAKIGLGSQREPWPVTSGRDVPVLKSRESIQFAMEEVKQGRPVATMKGKAQAVEIAGKQHGDVPAWLNRAAAKAGVTKVWDNRDGLKDNPKRPHFVSADGNKTPFWPPKNLTTDDINFGG